MASQLTLATLLVKLVADTKQYSEKMGGAGKETDEFGKRTETTSAKLTKMAGGAMVAVGVAAAAMAQKSIQEFQTFEQGLSEVFTLIPGKSEAAYASMEADVLEFSAAVGRQTDETIPAMYQAISAGVPSDNVFEFMKVASDAALGGVTTLETAVDGITSVTNAYGTEILNAAEAADVMFTTVKLGKTNFEQLSQSLFNVIPTAASLGVSFEDVSSQLAALTLQGTPTSVATTQIRAALVEASKGGTKLSEAIRELTGKSFTDLIAGGQTSSEIFDMLRSSMPEQEFKDLFGSVEALNAVLGITGPNADSAAAAFAQMKDSSGAVAEAAETMAASYQHTIDETMAAKEQVMILIGEGLVPGQQAAMEFARDTMLLAGALLQLNRGADAASQGVTDMVVAGEDADVNAAKLIDTWTSLDDFWGRSVFGRGKLTEDMGRVVASSVDLDGSFAEVEASLRELDPAFDVAANGMIYLDGSTVASIDTLRAMQEETKMAGAAMVAASADANMLGYAVAETATATDEAVVEVEELTAVYLGAGSMTDMYGQAAQRSADASAHASVVYQLQAEQLAAVAESARAANVALYEMVNGAVTSAQGPINALVTAQADLVEAQGEWVQVSQDNSSQLGDINAQLAADLSNEQVEAMEEILTTTTEGGQEWLSAWQSLQGDLTASQRNELVAQLADVQSTHGEIQMAFTGDAAASEEAQARISEAYAEISAAYKQTALEIFESKLGDVIAEDGLAAAQAMITMQEGLGLIGPEEAAMLQEVANKTAAIEEAVGSMTEKFLADGDLTIEEAGLIANAVGLIEEGATYGTDALLILAENGITSMSQLGESATGTIAPFTSAKNIAQEYGDMLNGIPTDITTNVVTNYSTTGDPSSNPGSWNENSSGSGGLGGGGQAEGGYTGAGDPSVPSGHWTHLNEYVFSSPAVNALGLDYLEELHQSAKHGPASYMNSGNTQNTIQVSPGPGLNAGDVADEVMRRLGAQQRTGRAAGWRPG